MHNLIPKNKKIVYGIIVFFVIAAVVSIWNNFQIEVSERPIKPIRPPAIISGECGIEQCHGPDITCGPNIPDGCTTEMRIDDFCRQYVRCEKVGRECRLVKEPKFEECRSCIEKCNQEEDPERAFQCAAGCEEGTNDSKQIDIPEESRYCVDYLGNPDPYGPCSTLEIEARKCKNIGNCRATCAFGCVNKNWDITTGREDCLAIPQYQCECINDFCQIR